MPGLSSLMARLSRLLVPDGRISPLALFLLVLLAAACLLPAPWGILPAFALVFCAAGLVLHTRLQRTWKAPWRLTHPLPALEKLDVSGDMLITGRRLTEACLPFDVTTSIRLRPGALLWASAVTVTASLAGPDDRQAMLEGVRPLGFSEDKFLARCPIQQEISIDGMSGFIVRDGHKMRAYIIGDPAALFGACARVWEQQAREITPEDALRLPPAGPGMYGFATAAADEGGMGPLTYLGALRISPALGDVSWVRHLQDDGWIVDIRPSTRFPGLEKELRALSSPHADDGPALHIGPEDLPGDACVLTPEDAPLLGELLAQGRDRACRDNARLTQLLAFFAGLTLACALWSLPAWLLILPGLMLLPTLTKQPPSFTGSEAFRPRSGLLFVSLGWVLVFSLGMGWFLSAAVPYWTTPCLHITFAALACTAMRCYHPGWTVPAGGLVWCAAVLLISGLPLLSAAFALAAGLLAGLVLFLILEQMYNSSICQKCS